MKKQYCAIIGDINKSRQLEKRHAVQKKFERVIEQINKEFKNEIASKFLITLGDEFQGLLYTPAKSYHFARRFQDLMGAVPFSFGIGIGPLATQLIPKSAIGMDGECFYRARTALEQAKKKRKTIYYDIADPLYKNFSNAVVHLLEHQWYRFTDQQKEIAHLVHLNSQKNIARNLHITKQAVSKVINSTPIIEWNTAENILREYLASSVHKSENYAVNQKRLTMIKSTKKG